MRLSDLWDAEVRTLDGERLGSVHEVHAEAGRITALTCGPGSFIERLTAKKHGRRIPWECVCKVSDKKIVVTPDPPQRSSKPKSGPRSRRRTPPASGRRSKR
jgi:sporulation protein YlmC with PRC-barrel domain